MKQDRLEYEKRQDRELRAKAFLDAEEEKNKHKPELSQEELKATVATLAGILEGQETAKAVLDDANLHIFAIREPANPEDEKKG